MSKLYFLRHGVAYMPDEWKGDNDELRPLTDEGIAAMKREAKYMRDALKLKVDRLITSPLVRAHDTARYVAKALKLDLDESKLLKPGFDLQALDELLGKSDDVSNIMIVGHEPDFSRTISQLIGGGDVIMRKGGLARVDLQSRKPLRGELVWLLTPALVNA